MVDYASTHAGLWVFLYMLWLLWPFIQTVVYVENSYDAFGEEILVVVMCMVSVPKVEVLEILKIYQWRRFV